LNKVLILLSVPSLLVAMLRDPIVKSGQVEIFQNESALHVTASDRSIIQWNDFSLLENEQARFSLPTSQCAVLNRVVGGIKSEIFGKLECNGKLILINPFGILIGSNAQIDTFSLIASSMDILDQDFLSGSDLRFISQNGQPIVNAGVIAATEDIYLLAPSVFQKGVCLSANGQIVLASCQDAVVCSADGKIRLSPAQLERLEPGNIHCSGYLQALQAIVLAEGNLASLAINLDGLIEADQVSINGKGASLQVGGSIRASDLDIVSHSVDLLPELLIDLSQSGDGGVCHIAANESLVMAPSARILASSLEDGCGGEVRLFSSGSTLFQGRVISEGGGQSGNGGFVEISGNLLAFKGYVSTVAPHGIQGTLLLDPVDITILPAPAVTANVNISLPNPVTYTPVNGSACSMSVGSSVILDTDLATALNANDVVIDTVGSMGACPGDIIFDPSATVSYSSTNSLTLSAAGSIRFFSSVVNSSSGPISISQAGGDVEVIANLLPVSVETTGGPISFSNIGGDLTLQGGNAAGAHARILAANAALTVSVGGDINIQGGTVSSSAASLRNSVGNLDILQAGNIVLDAGSSIADIFSGSGGNMTINCLSASVSALNNMTTAAISADGDLNLTVSSGDLQITAGSNAFAVANASFELRATVNNNVTITTAPGGYGAMFGDRESTTIEAVLGSITVNGPSQIYSGNLPGAQLQLTAGLDIAINDNATLDIFNPTGSITLVVDNLFPSSPGFGPGQFILGPSAAINGQGQSLQIFTATPAQNSIQGMLNGVLFSPGPPLTNTNQEQYGIYYPDSFFVSDYVVFYKIPVNAIPPGPVINIPGAIQTELGDFAEMFRLLHPYSEYLYGSIQFFETYSSPEILFGLPYVEQDFFYIRKKSNIRGAFSIEYDSARF